jgi:putative ABC transport system substrate-binding protein
MGERIASYVAVFVQVLRQLGWIDGQNLRLDIRWFDNNSQRARAFATELAAIPPISSCRQAGQT